MPSTTKIKLPKLSGGTKTESSCFIGVGGMCVLTVDISLQVQDTGVYLKEFL